MFKKSMTAFILVLFSLSSVFWATQKEIETANFLAWKDIIKDYSSDTIAYRLDDTITRRETMKIVMKLSWITIEDKCEEKFDDVKNGDWGCKYVEAALDAWFIAENDNFRPDDNITKTESMKLVLKAKSINKSQKTDNWQEDYMETAFKYGIIETKYSDYNADAKRWWIFTIATATIVKEEEIKKKQEEKKYSDEA